MAVSWALLTPLGVLVGEVLEFKYGGQTANPRYHTSAKWVQRVAIGSKKMCRLLLPSDQICTPMNEDREDQFYRYWNRKCLQ